jgi:hypothetical protein
MVLGFKPTNEDICYMGIFNDTYSSTFMAESENGRLTPQFMAV